MYFGIYIKEDSIYDKCQEISNWLKQKVNPLALITKNIQDKADLMPA